MNFINYPKEDIETIYVPDLMPPRAQLFIDSLGIKCSICKKLLNGGEIKNRILRHGDAYTSMYNEICELEDIEYSTRSNWYVCCDCFHLITECAFCNRILNAKSGFTNDIKHLPIRKHIEYKGKHFCNDNCKNEYYELYNKENICLKQSHTQINQIRRTTILDGILD